MKVPVLFIAIVICFLSTGYGQYIKGQRFVGAHEIPGLVLQLKHNPSGARKAELLLKTGYGHLYKPGANKADLDSALQYARQAATFSLQIKNVPFFNESLLLSSTIYMEQENMPVAKSLLPAMNDSTRLKMLLCLGIYNYGKDLLATTNHALLDSAAHYSQAALKLALTSKVLKAETLYWLEAVAKRYYALHLGRQAVTCYLLMQDHVDGASIPSKARVLISISGIYTDEGEFIKATSYGINAEKALNRNSTDADYSFVYLNLGSLCTLEGKPDQAFVYYQKILADPKRYVLHASIYGLVNSSCNCLRKMKRNDEVIPYLQQFSQRWPVANDYDKNFYHLALANAYREMKLFEPAEKNYLESIKYADLAQHPTAANYYGLGVLYSEFNEHAKAVVALKIAEKGLATMNAIVISGNYSKISESEAALGDYESAYRYLIKGKTMSDSIFVVSKAAITQELEVKYQTEKREAALQLKENDIRILNQDAVLMKQDANLQAAKLTEASLLTQKKEIELELKRKDYELLTQHSKLQEAAIERATARRKVTILLIALLAVIIALLCWLFWSKIKSNKVITNKNGLLQQLVKDKSWLVKEMHHRVKNNLHTIMNLLEFQSAYLKDDALDAIRNSQTRIFSMSLIHQKLSQTDDAKTIDMAYYIPELVAYLKDSFSDRPIHVNMNIDHTVFDVEEAVPLGLIINEAVTNSMKYAFTNNRSGEITISMKASGADEYELIIADNGTGLSEGFDLDQVQSLGFQLIKGLSEQLEARLQLVNEDGLKITLSHISVYRTSKLKRMENELSEHMSA